jgi:hypothetical protein
MSFGYQPVYPTQHYTDHFHAVQTSPYSTPFQTPIDTKKNDIHHQPTCYPLYPEASHSTVTFVEPDIKLTMNTSTASNISPQNVNNVGLENPTNTDTNYLNEDEIEEESSTIEIPHHYLNRKEVKLNLLVKRIVLNFNRLDGALHRNNLSASVKCVEILQQQMKDLQTQYPDKMELINYLWDKVSHLLTLADTKIKKMEEDKAIRLDQYRKVVMDLRSELMEGTKRVKEAAKNYQNENL